MKQIHDLATLPWKLTGWMPELWRAAATMELGLPTVPEMPSVPARVPGSVQAALRAVDALPDWNVGLNARACEWVENRHWLFEVELPDAWIRPGRTHRLRCDGLDGFGSAFLNGKQIGVFANAFVPHTFDLTAALRDTGNRLQIAFECSPRWLGQIGFTSRMTEWKPRFNYTWDWTSRLAQIGIWDAITLVVTDGVEIQHAGCGKSILQFRRSMIPALQRCRPYPGSS